MIGVGTLATVAIWVFYFFWRRSRQGVLNYGVQERNLFADQDQCNVASLLGVQPMSQYDWAQMITRGFPAGSVELFVERSGLSRNEALLALGMSSKQFLRRSQSGVLSGDESEKLYRLARVVSAVAALFGDIDPRVAWLRKPHPVLRGLSPLDLAVTEPGAQEVLRIIVSAEHGIPV